MNNVYEDQVIEAARQGLREGFTTMTPEMEKLFRLIYRAGYKQSRIDMIEQQSKVE